MTNRPLRSALFIAALMVGAAPVALAEENQDFFSSLVGPGESLVFEVDMFPDGREGRLEQEGNSETGITRLEAEGGRVSIDSPRFVLRSRFLLYERDAGQLIARGDVFIDRDGVAASGEELILFPETGEVRITGTPKVRQQTNEELNSFEGMELFEILPGEDYTEIRMIGGETIIADLKPSESVMEEDSRREPLRIIARRRPEQEPVIIARSSETSNVGSFRAEGSVTLESTTMNLRADQIDFDGENQRIEALNNVFMRQDDIEADAGRMVYDLATNVMVLTVNPIVQEISADRIRRQSGVNRFTIVRSEDGSVSTQAAGRPKIEIIPNPAANPAAPTTRPTDVEIDLNTLGTTTN